MTITRFEPRSTAIGGDRFAKLTTKYFLKQVFGL